MESAVKDIAALFGSQVFSDTVMQDRLPKHIYQSLKKTMEEGLPLDENVADVVANAMKDWALEKGATHYTHWFQPMTGITAEKHDAFITPVGAGKVIMDFSGKSLIKGEPDASSFPSGGLRSTFEARGYTAWDPTSYAFVKDNTLCIPTAFCSYGGQTLDKKTPLLRSMEAINRQALRILHLFGHPAIHVHTTVGPEQEYFLVDLALFNRRKDLKVTGRTLFGAKPCKGQELEDHYFGTLKPRVAGFMQELDEELWKLGIYAKTEHNEVAPSQHELAPIFANSNVSTDHNQLTMEYMKKVATRHNMACLLHEKPFAGINGSGKHNNWSMSTDDGQNLLEPGDSPEENAQFLLFICAVVKAVDDYCDLMRVAVATAGNDHRLGGYEAPPAIVSIFLGDELTGILDAIETGIPNKATLGGFLEIGVTAMPKLPKDTTDRNRTSPFAFTGNKFEFRMTGSSSSIAGVNFILNTIVAEVLEQFADELEKADDFHEALKELLRRTIKNHKRILFNGNNYSQAWVEEAARRGLPNYPSAIDALPHFADPKNMAVFVKHKIFTEQELKFRVETLIEGYAKIVHMEALTMLDIARQEILPAVMRYGDRISKTLLNKRACALDLDVSAEENLLKKLSEETSCTAAAIEALDQALQGVASIKDPLLHAQAFRKQVVPAMEALRAPVDRLELIVAKDYWPMPTYSELLFST
jgi:glutamine synthetase